MAQQQDDGIQRIVRDAVPLVERAVGLTFRRQPMVAVRSRDQLRAYLERKVRLDTPPEELAAEARAYKTFRLIPDTMDLVKVQLDVLQEQVMGFYDPDSATFFVIRGGDPIMVRLTASHELVHALQDQYMRLGPILRMRRQNDRQMAAHALVEGQATVAGLLAMSPSLSPAQIGQALESSGNTMSDPRMAALASAPRILRDGLMFAYLDGAKFFVGFDGRRASAEEQPFGERLPTSTEQILHASKYTARERPARLAITPPGGDTLVIADDFGEFDTRVALMTWGIAEPEAVAAAAGWNGDRFALFGSRAGTALVWATAWDTAPDAQDFERTLRRAWEGAARGSTGRRWQIDAQDVGGVKIVRLVDAPTAWTGWRALPAVRVVR